MSTRQERVADFIACVPKITVSVKVSYDCPGIPWVYTDGKTFLNVLTNTFGLTMEGNTTVLELLAEETAEIVNTFQEDITHLVKSAAYASQGVLVFTNEQGEVEKTIALAYDE